MKAFDCTNLPKNINFDWKTQSLRDAYIDVLRNSPTRYHLTLTFKYRVYEKVAVDLLNEFLKYMNRAILKKRYTVSEQALEGFIVKEATHAMENVHFHIMIADSQGNLPAFSRLEEIIEKKVGAANRTVRKLNEINEYLLQNYYEGDEESSLEKYLTKIFEKNDLPTLDKIKAICPMGPRPVSFY